MKQIYTWATVCALTFLVGSLLPGQQDRFAERASRLHSSALVMDTHIDVTPKLQRPDWKFRFWAKTPCA